MNGITYRCPPYSLVDFMSEFNVTDDEFLYRKYKEYLNTNIGVHWYPDGSATVDEWFSRILIEELLSIKQGK